MGSPPRWVVVAVALAGAALAGVAAARFVGSDPSARTAGPPTSSFTPAAPTSAAPTSRSASPAPAPATPPRRSSSPSRRPSSPPAATASSSRGPARDGDIDGDGRIDAVTVVGSGSAYSLSALLTRLGPAVVPFAGSPDGAPAVLGVVDVDRDGRAEVFVRADQGASTAFATVFRLVGTRLSVLTRSGQQVALAYGGTVTHSDSWACTGGRIVTWTGESADGTAYAGTETTYRLLAATLVTTGARPLAVDGSHPAPSGCGSVTY